MNSHVRATHQTNASLLCLLTHRTRLEYIMVVICLGPCCIPLHALLPFLVGMAHQRGYLKWVRKEWFTWRWLGPRARRALWMKVSDEELARTAIKTMEPAKKAA